jgi:hypothetical protein
MARSLPLLKKWGNFGSRMKNYKDAGESRYISAANNYKLNDKLFRDEDLYVLDYTFSEGKMQEPVSFCPIIPLAILESFMIPGTGWNQVIHARHIDDVFANIRAMIYGEITHCRPLRYWLKDFHGTLESPYMPKKNQKTLTEAEYHPLNSIKEYYLGAYSYNPNENLLRITELPIGVCSDDYVNGSEKQRKSERKLLRQQIQLRGTAKKSCFDIFYNYPSAK